VSAIVDLVTAVAAEGRWIAAELPDDQRHRHRSLLQHLRRSDARSFVAVGDARIVGELGIATRSSGLLEFGMVVAADWRGRGVGGALLTEGIAWGREIGAHEMQLEVFPHNLAARALYRRFGFVEGECLRRHIRRRNGELWDCIRMSLLLNE
jgi:putative acetyltransferase